MRPPLRRVLAIDAGGSRIKLLLVHGDFGRIKVLRQELIDLKAEGLVSAEEIQAHLHAVISELGHPPLALVLPEHLSTSLVIDLPLTTEEEVQKLIADEAIKLSGVSESRIIYDFARLESTAQNRQQFWVTFCPEGNIQERVLQLGVEQEDICEVTTVGNALIVAHRMALPSSQHAILLQLGAETTVMAAVNSGQGAFAATFQTGSDYFTRTLARTLNLSESAAEELKRTRNLLEGPDICPELVAAVDEWADEVRRQVEECFRQNPNLAAARGTYELVYSGGGFNQPGLVDYLAKKASIKVRSWPSECMVDGITCPSGFEVALGTALQALGYSSQPVSLLPDHYRAGWQKRVARQRLELASLLVLALCILALAVGTWRKLSLIGSKESLLRKVQASQEAVQANSALTGELLVQYESLRPILAAQQNTRDTLRTIGLLQQTRTNRNLWYLVLADQQTYFSFPLLSGTNTTLRAATTNIHTGLIQPLQASAPPGKPATTNITPAKPGFIAEFSIPGEPEVIRQTLGDLVNELKQNSLYSQADLLSEDLRRNLADPRLVTPDRHFVLSLNFAESAFQRPVILPKPSTAPPQKRTRAFPAPREVTEVEFSR